MFAIVCCMWLLLLLLLVFLQRGVSLILSFPNWSVVYGYVLAEYFRRNLKSGTNVRVACGWDAPVYCYLFLPLFPLYSPAAGTTCFVPSLPDSTSTNHSRPAAYSLLKPPAHLREEDTEQLSGVRRRNLFSN